VLTEDLRPVGLAVSFVAGQVRRRRRITVIRAQALCVLDVVSLALVF